MIFSDYRIRTPPTHHFFMVLMQFGLCNPDNTSTNFKHVCNIDSHFKDNINLPSFNPCVFMIKTPLEGTFYGTPPKKSKITSFRPFFTWCWCSSDYVIRTTSAPIMNIYVTWIVILRTILIFLTLILMFLWFYLTWIYHFFCFVFKSKIQNWWNERDYDWWLHISIVQIKKSELVRIMKSEL